MNDELYEYMRQLRTDLITERLMKTVQLYIVYQLLCLYFKITRVTLELNIHPIDTNIYILSN